MNSSPESCQLPKSPPRLKCDSLMFRFPARLWKIVNSCTSGAIAWGPNGKTIRLIRSKFELTFLQSKNRPFKTENFSSFIRQLNLYGFRKVVAPMLLDGESIEEYDDLYEYRHPCFRQGRSELLTFVQRNCKKKKTMNESMIDNKRKQVANAALREVPPTEVNAEVERGGPFSNSTLQDENIYRQQVHKNTEDSTEKKLSSWVPDNGIENHPLLKPVSRMTPLLQVNPKLNISSKSSISTAESNLDPDSLYDPNKHFSAEIHGSATKESSQVLVKNENNPKSNSLGFDTSLSKVPVASDQKIITNSSFNFPLNLGTFLKEHAHKTIECEHKTIIESLEDLVDQVLEQESAFDSEEIDDHDDIYLLNKSIQMNSVLKQGKTQISNTSVPVSDNQKMEKELMFKSRSPNTAGRYTTTEKKDLKQITNGITAEEGFVCIDISNLMPDTTDTTTKNCLLRLDSAIFESAKQTAENKASVIISVPNSSGVLDYVIFPKKE